MCKHNSNPPEQLYKTLHAPNIAHSCSTHEVEVWRIHAPRKHSQTTEMMF